jgi:hypothetical protein
MYQHAHPERDGMKERRAPPLLEGIRFLSWAQAVGLACGGVFYCGHWAPGNTLFLLGGCTTPKGCSRHRRALFVACKASGDLGKASTVWARREVTELVAWAPLQRPEAEKVRQRVASFTNWLRQSATPGPRLKLVWSD